MSSPALINGRLRRGRTGFRKSDPATMVPSRLERWLRTRLMQRLREFTGGRILINDSDGTRAGGTSGIGQLDAVIHVHDPAFYRHVAVAGSLGAADSFIRGEWTSPDLVALLRLFAINLPSVHKAERGATRIGKSLASVSSRFRRNSHRGSKRNITAHYDLGNDFFELFLDPTMMYSSACFDRPGATLQEASESKLERICRRARLEPGDRVLEIGTGWGGFAEYAARNYGCHVTTTTISEKQYRYSRQRLQKFEASGSVKVLQQDYRDLQGRFDKLVSIEMIEAVGFEYLDTFFDKCRQLLKPGGRMVLQSIVMPEQRFQQYRRSIDFVRRHIFPGGFLPSVSALQESVGRTTDLRLVSVEDFSPSYARTLHEWRARFFNRLDDVRRLGYSDEFIRLWDYYLAYCEAGFWERAVGLVQLEWVKAGNQ